MSARVTGVQWLHTDRQGWARAWAVIKERFGSYECRSADGECWQYMGSDERVHHFRHRNYGGARFTWTVAIAEGDFDPEPAGPMYQDPS